MKVLKVFNILTNKRTVIASCLLFFFLAVVPKIFNAIEASYYHWIIPEIGYPRSIYYWAESGVKPLTIRGKILWYNHRWVSSQFCQLFGYITAFIAVVALVAKELREAR